MRSGTLPGIWLLMRAEPLRSAIHGASAPTDIWTITAVVVAAMGSVFVAWQALETHRVTTLSQQTLSASYLLAIDSARNRLDQDAPRIDVYVEQVTMFAAGSADGPGEEIEAGARWELPADAARLLRVQALVSVANLMTDRTVHIRVSGLLDSGMVPDRELLLAPSAAMAYVLAATFTVRQWTAQWAAHRAATDLPCVADGQVICRDDRDEGVVDTWPLRLSAWPIQSVPGSADQWQLTAETPGSDWFEIGIRPLRQRSYWISQRDGIALPEPSYYRLR